MDHTNLENPQVEALTGQRHIQMCESFYPHAATSRRPDGLWQSVYGVHGWLIFTRGGQVGRAGAQSFVQLPRHTHILVFVKYSFRPVRSRAESTHLNVQADAERVPKAPRFLSWRLQSWQEARGLAASLSVSHATSTLGGGSEKLNLVSKYLMERVLSRLRSASCSFSILCTSLAKPFEMGKIKLDPRSWRNFWNILTCFRKKKTHLKIDLKLAFKNIRLDRCKDYCSVFAIYTSQTSASLMLTHNAKHHQRAMLLTSIDSWIF